VLTLSGVTGRRLCEPALPTTAATETLLGATVSIAKSGCGTGFVFAAGELMPTQPDVHVDTARRAVRNTRTAPRFERKEFNVDLLSLSKFVFLRRGSIRCASKAGEDKGQGGNASVGWENQQLVRRTVLGHGMDSSGTVLLISKAGKKSRRTMEAVLRTVL